MKILETIPKNFYGDDVRWFFGTVINSHPPAGLEGRVKVRINGVHSPSTGDIPERDLPWAQVMLPSTEGGVSGIGRITQIVQGAFVFGVFMDGKTSQLPLVLGSLSRTEYPSAIQTERRNPNTNQTVYDNRSNVVTSSFRIDDDPDAGEELRAQQSMKFLIDNGYSLIHAAAITGALLAQSNLVTYPKDWNSPKFNSLLGIAGWKKVGGSTSRYNNLLEFARQSQSNSDWKLFSVQIQFVLYELRGVFNQVNSRLIATTDIKSASEVVNRYYLKNTNVSDNIAQKVYNEVIG
jgi:hypothetical protein|tara:strand:+ start:3375 stop:4250 length:876 start_codon:yes stop_codon:yes gene_type:complete